jgi:RNA polymerase sigma factor (sigma-70 family)
MNLSIDKLNHKLIQKVLDNDNSAVIEFIKLAEPLVWGALYKYDQLSQEEREDIFQNIFLKLFSNEKRRIKMWKGNSKFSTYLYMITMNSTLDYLKSSGYVKTKDYKEIDSLDIETQNNEFSDVFSLKQAISKLKASEKEVIKLFYFKQLKEKEIAVHLEKSINTISSLKYRAIQKMKLFLKEKD